MCDYMEILALSYALRLHCSLNGDAAKGAALQKNNRASTKQNTTKGVQFSFIWRQHFH